MRKVFCKFALLPLLVILTAGDAVAQRAASGPRYELGAGVVGSFYDSASFSGPSATATAGFDRGLGASAWIGHHMYPKVSGEIRYDYLRNNLKLESAGTSVGFGAESHAIHYDIHYHFTSSDASIRPFVIAGGGVKLFRGTGAERSFQPLSQIAVLTRTTETAGLITFGFGVKMKLGEKALLRLEFRDNFTRFPKKVIAPNRATGGDGWIHNFLPTAGVSVLF